MSSPTDPSEDPPSKTQRKREMHALQDLGEALVALSPERLERIGLPEDLLRAILEAQGIRKHEARRRQLQYVGRLMRDVDPDSIRRQLEALEGHSRAHTAWLHRVEHWREELIADDDALARLLAEHPGADAQHLRTLIRNARKETAEARPPRAFRELFRVLREILPEPGAPAPAPPDLEP